MSDQQTTDASSEPMRERIPGGRLKLWVLLEGDRWLLTVVLLGAVFLVVVVLEELTAPPIRAILEQRDPVETLFQAMVTAIITGVTLVVSINQLVLSQELGAVGDQRNRMEGALSFREDTESAIEEAVSPADPSQFFVAMFEAIQRDGRALISQGSTQTELESYGEDIATEASRVSENVAGTEFGSFDLLQSVLDFNYSGKIYDGRRLRATTDDASDAQQSSLDSLLETLELFGPAREHFKTLYFQWALMNLSRDILYAAVPALITAISMILFFSSPGSLPGATFGVENLFWVVALGTVVSVSPFMLLVSYILRIATVTKRTLAIGPFILRETNENGPGELH